MKEFLKKLKPMKYITLLKNYNKLSIEYETLLNAEKNKCFESLLSQINIPEQIRKRDRRIKQLENQNKVLKEMLKNE